MLIIQKAKTLAKLAKKSSATEVCRDSVRTAEDIEKRLQEQVGFYVTFYHGYSSRPTSRGVCMGLLQVEAKILETQKDIHTNLRQAHVAWWFVACVS